MSSELICFEFKNMVSSCALLNLAHSYATFDAAEVVGVSPNAMAAQNKHVQRAIIEIAFIIFDIGLSFHISYRQKASCGVTCPLVEPQMIPGARVPVLEHA